MNIVLIKTNKKRKQKRQFEFSIHFRGDNALYLIKQWKATFELNTFSWISDFKITLKEAILDSYADDNWKNRENHWNVSGLIDYNIDEVDNTNTLPNLDEAKSGKLTCVEPQNQRFNELVAYKERNGHCDVPRQRDGLGKWVANQRINYQNKKKGKKGKHLKDEREEKLRDVSFDFDKSKTRSKGRKKKQKETKVAMGCHQQYIGIIS